MAMTFKPASVHEPHPSSRQLARSTLTALAVATVLLFTVVLPAEYGKDPTGIGSLLGLTEMGKIKMGLQAEASTGAPPAPTTPAVPAVAEDTTPRVTIEVPATPAIQAVPSLRTPPAPQVSSAVQEKTDAITFSLKPGEGAEVKMTMKENARVNYNWQATGGVVNYDTHGDPVNAPKGFYHGYGKGRGAAGDQGTLVAAFDGKHGWFWRNRSGGTVVVALNIKGGYLEVKRVL